MTISIAGLAGGFATLFLLSQGMQAGAADIKVLSAGGMRPVLQTLATSFEEATGHTLTMTFGPAGTIMKRVYEGEAVDLVVTPTGLDRLLKEGKTVAANVAAVARSGLAVAVRKGAPKPDISTPEAFRRAVLAARSIAHSDPAGGGAGTLHLMKVFERLGIADEMKAKAIFPRSGHVGTLVASGQAELGMQQHQELITVAGIEIVGPLPGDLQNNTIFSAAILVTSKNFEAAKSLVDFLRAPKSAIVIKAQGMEPG